MRKVSRENPALPNNNIIVIGASGSGKSSFLREKVDLKQPRIVAWDPDKDFNLPRIHDMQTFIKHVKKCGFGNIRCALTVQPTEENFETWAQWVFAICHAAAPMTVIADEIADVTRVTKASPHWGQLCRKIRKYGGTLCAITQRPEEADKTIFNQARFKWCGALGSESSYKKMANEMCLPLAEIRDLNNIEQVQIEYWIKEGTKPAEKGVIMFKQKPAVKKPIAKATAAKKTAKKPQNNSSQ